MANSSSAQDPVRLAQERARLRRTVLILAPVLILGGLAVLLFVDRMMMPLRILVGLGDIVAGVVLLVLLRQKYFEK
jgi:uncharacterized membrane protein HdeD (DUF308 family)